MAVQRTYWITKLFLPIQYRDYLPSFRLNGYVGEDVTIRFDPRDLSYIHVYKDNVLVCKAHCFELSGKSMSLQEVRQARNHEAKAQ